MSLDWKGIEELLWECSEWPRSNAEPPPSILKYQLEQKRLKEHNDMIVGDNDGGEGAEATNGQSCSYFESLKGNDYRNLDEIAQQVREVCTSYTNESIEANIRLNKVHRLKFDKADMPDIALRSSSSESGRSSSPRTPSKKPTGPGNTRPQPSGSGNARPQPSGSDDASPPQKDAPTKNDNYW